MNEGVLRKQKTTKKIKTPHDTSYVGILHEIATSNQINAG